MPPDFGEVERSGGFGRVISVESQSPPRAQKPQRNKASIKLSPVLQLGLGLPRPACGRFKALELPPPPPPPKFCPPPPDFAHLPAFLQQVGFLWLVAI